mmetsp:Transcript_36742/g.88324  ORF Transcript_36742/g.88324 Transcript_36742/m.88324 type:complete len:248 (+) Transcript_36742:35-778(+)
MVAPPVSLPSPEEAPECRISQDSASFSLTFHEWSEDPEHWILRITAKPRVLTDNDLDAAFGGIMKTMVVPHVAVYDMRHLQMPGISAARKAGKWCATNHANPDLTFTTSMKAIVVLFSPGVVSHVTRTVVAIITAICPPICPLHMCNTEAQAVEFLRSNCGAHARAAAQAKVAEKKRGTSAREAMTCWGGLVGLRKALCGFRPKKPQKQEVLVPPAPPDLDLEWDGPAQTSCLMRRDPTSCIGCPTM